RRPERAVAPREDRVPHVRLPLDPGHVPALPLRPDHAARLEGLHPGHPGVDRRGGDPDDGSDRALAGAQTLVRTLTMLSRVKDIASAFMLTELVKGLKLTGRYLFSRKITIYYPEE